MTFENIEPIRTKNILDILKWKIKAKPVKWSRPQHGTTDRPPEKVDGAELRVCFVNHSTVLLQTCGLNILTDPVWSYRVSPVSWLGPKRVHAPGIKWNDLPSIDVVLISHSHYDHLDIPTLKKLVQRDNPLIIVPIGVDRIIRKHCAKARLIVMGWGDKHPFSNDLAIHMVPAQHWSSRRLFDKNETLWCGYVLELADGKIYYAADTGYGSGRVFQDLYKRFGMMRLALIPIGAFEPRWFMKDSHVTPEEAVKIFHDVHAKYGLGIHWGAFQLSDEGREDPIRKLQETGVDPSRFRTLDPGQHWLIPAN